MWLNKTNSIRALISALCATCTTSCQCVNDLLFYVWHANLWCARIICKFMRRKFVRHQMVSNQCRERELACEIYSTLTDIPSVELKLDVKGLRWLDDPRWELTSNFNQLILYQLLASEKNLENYSKFQKMNGREGQWKYSYTNNFTLIIRVVKVYWKFIQKLSAIGWWLNDVRRRSAYEICAKII